MCVRISCKILVQVVLQVRHECNMHSFFRLLMPVDAFRCVKLVQSLRYVWTKFFARPNIVFPVFLFDGVAHVSIGRGVWRRRTDRVRFGTQFLDFLSLSPCSSTN